MPTNSKKTTQPGQAKINEAFKKALDDKIVGGVDKGIAAATHSRSKGAIFSRSRTGDSMRELIDSHMNNTITENLHKMSKSEFEDFAARLTTLKGIGKKNQ